MEGAARKETPFDTRPAFEKLTDVMQTMAERNYGMKPQHLAVPLQLPAIKAIFGDRIYSEDNEDEEWGLRDLITASSTVQHLELRESKLNMADLANLLRVPIALKTFIYDLAPDAYNPEFRISFRRMHKALESQMDSLENIWLDSGLAYWNSPWLPERDDLAPMPSFANFKNLKVLRIGSTFIFNTNHDRQLGPLLPRRLHVLHLTHGGHENISSAIEELILQKDEHTPLLNKVVQEGPMLQWQSLWPSLRNVAKVAEENMVSFVTIDDGSDQLGRTNGQRQENAVERGW